MDTPTLTGFISWAATAMGVGESQLPSDSPFWGYAYNVAIAIVNDQLNCADSLLYTLAVYNLAGDNLINWAVDTSPSTFFADARKACGCMNFLPGTVKVSSDQATAADVEVVESLKNLTLGQLQNLKTPYGRQYLALASGVGNIWGIS